MYARRLSQAAKRTALQRRCEIDPLSGMSCTSVDDHHMSLPRIELDNINQPDDRRTKPCAPPLSGIAFLRSNQWSIRSAQCCISFVREPKKHERSVANVEFRSRGAAVDVDQICSGLAPAPSFLRAICSFPSFGITKFAAMI
jgi:hypothetical protein